MSGQNVSRRRFIAKASAGAAAITAGAGCAFANVGTKANTLAAFGTRYERTGIGTKYRMNEFTARLGDSRTSGAITLGRRIRDNGS